MTHLFFAAGTLLKRNGLRMVIFTLFTLPAMLTLPVSAAKLPDPTLTLTPSPAIPGRQVTLNVSIPLNPDLHIYGPNVSQSYYATSITLKEKGPIIWDDEWIFPKFSTLNLMGESLQIIEQDPKTHQVLILRKGKLDPSARPGQYTVSVTITYQACSEVTCLPPIKDKLVSTNILIDATGKAVTTAPTSRPAATQYSTSQPVTSQPAAFQSSASPPVSSSATSETSQGYGTTISFLNHQFDLQGAGFTIPLIIAFIAGLILNIMPCVLPVIPIKILQLTRQAQQEHHSPLRLSLLFAAGIILFFLTIGIIALILKTGFTWGQFFQSQTALIVMSLILVLLALGMFDIYQINVPSFIANRTIVQKGYLGAFSMGFFAGILSTPCSFGILGAAVAWAQSQRPPVTLLGFITIGIGMAFPYVMLSAFPCFTQRIPKAGRWSELFKQSMGFLLLAVALFLISSLPKELIMWTLLYMVLFAFVVWFWGEILEFRSGYFAKMARICAALVLIIGGWAMLKPNGSPLQWTPLNAATLQCAMNTGRDVLVEFTADWCINCKTVEYFVFENVNIKKELRDRQVVLLRADMTRPNSYIEKQLLEWTGTSGPPYTVLIKPNGRKILLSGIYTANQLIEALNSKP